MRSKSGLQERDWPSVRHYADSLHAYTSAEPLPWTDMLIKRARLLADAGEKGMSTQTRAGLEALRTECQRMSARRSVDGGAKRRSAVRLKPDSDRRTYSVTICRTVRPSARRSKPSLSWSSAMRSLSSRSIGRRPARYSSM